MAKQAPKKKGANGYKLPDPLPEGEILTDLCKKKWKLGKSIGQGGFGEIYSAQDVEKKSNSYPYVVKIEPHENGPLFVEINFYIRNAKAQDVEEFKKEKELKTLGMPVYLGSGSHENKNQKYRFLVMDKFGSDIWKLFLDNDKVFPTATVFKLGAQILDVLEYIHDRGYVHADIKGANVLLGLNKENQNQVFLVDFGLAAKFITDGEFKPNPKKAHDGTIEYLSRDAHCGVPTMRGDLEILAYNLIQWLGCTLPWEKDLSNPVEVHESKKQNMCNENSFLKKCFGSRTIPVGIKDFIKYVNKLSFKEKPNYSKIKQFFVSEIENNGQKLSSPLIFKDKAKTTSPNKRQKAEKKTSNKKMKNDDHNTEENIQNHSEENVEEVVTKKRNVTEKKKKSKDEENSVEIPEEKPETSKVKKQNGVGKSTVKRRNGAIIWPHSTEENEQNPSEENVEEVDTKKSETAPKRNVTERKKKSKNEENVVEVPEEKPETSKVKKQNGVGKTTVKRKNGADVKSSQEKSEDNEEIKRLKSKIEGKAEVSDDFDGFTPEMRAIAMKKSQTGTKKTVVKKKSKENINTNGESEDFAGPSKEKDFVELQKENSEENKYRKNLRTKKVVNYS